MLPTSTVLYLIMSKRITQIVTTMNALAKGCLALWLEQSNTSKWLIISSVIISWVMISLSSSLSLIGLIPLGSLLILFFYLGFIIRTYSTQIRNMHGHTCHYNYMDATPLSPTVTDQVSTKETLDKPLTGKNGLKKWRIIVSKMLK